MDALLPFLLFVVVGIVGILCGIALDKDYGKRSLKKENIGNLVLHIDGNEFVATTLELQQDILQKKTGDVVTLTVEFRQHSETNKDFNATVNN